MNEYRRGQAASRTARIDDLGIAIHAFERAVRLDAGFAAAWAALARARATRALLDGRDLHQLQLADAEAVRALALDRDQADAHVALGHVRLGLHRDPAGAEVWFLRGRALGANAARDRLWHVCALNAQGRFDEALQAADEAIARDPEFAALHAWRGLLLHALHRYDEEMLALKNAVAIDPRSPEAVFHLGMGYARRRQYDRALPALRHAVELSGEGAYYLSWLGRMAADAGDVPAAERVIRELQQIDRSRGVAPALRDAVAYHVAARRLAHSGGL